MRNLFATLVLLAVLLMSCVGHQTDAYGTSGNDTDTVVTIVTMADTMLTQTDEAFEGYTPQQIDSLIFRLEHHYTINFNFLVKADSLMLIPRDGDLVQDTCHVYDGELVAVAAMNWQSDTLWIKVAHDQMTMGWIPEQELLRGVTPDDPISEVLDALTGSRSIWMSALVAIGVVLLVVRQGRSRVLSAVKNGGMPMVYPRLFLGLVALMASLYVSVQNFVPEFWQEYYFHPTLNPLILPSVMAMLMTVVWLVLITAIAVVDEVYHHLYFADGIAFLLELLGIGMVVYLVIGWTTLYYIGYLLLVAFIIFLVFYGRKAGVKS